MVEEELDVAALLADLDDNVKTEIASTPAVENWNPDTFDVATLPITARRWTKIPDLVAVVADLKNSTRLGPGKHAASTASIYQAATGNVVTVYDKFGADFIQIQGDGAFALFWGDLRFERALCAGITVKTFSEDMVERLEKKWPDADPTGFKVGIASHRVLVKRIGTPRNPAQQEPVWAGKPVNYAAKAAQQADRHQLLVTGSVWDQIENNDYLTVTCPCNGGPSATLWTDVVIDKIPDDDKERLGRRLRSTWCVHHGAEYAAAVMAGKRKRDDADQAKSALSKQLMSNAIRVKAQVERRALRNRRVGFQRFR